MIYSAFSLNGAWEMNYCEDIYTGTENPWNEGFLIEHAVPGYWEDMTEDFLMAPFFCNLKINPEYGIQQYPIAGVAPDMALPNVVGNFFYRRTFICEHIENPAVLHFEGVQNAASIWLNDVYLGRHEGYSTPFDVEIPEDVLKDGENTLVLSISNHRLVGFAGEPVSGLTSRAANECTGGITGDIELRVYNSPLRDMALLVSEDCKNVEVKVDAVEQVTVEWAVYDGSMKVKSGTGQGDFSFDTEGMDCWSPENPKLYTLELTCGESILTRQFGVRRLTVDGAHFKLNGLPYYLRGICEHCYFPETVHPVHDISFYRNVIKTIKNLGFNFIRFHTFIPVEEYMQAADELGVLLHVESPNNTTLEEWKEIVSFCRRHSSVVIYCCGNELQIDDAFEEHLGQCAKEVHHHTDSLFSPMSAMRGLEYWLDYEKKEELVQEPFLHNPRRIKEVGDFSDMYSSYALGQFSYFSMDADPKQVSDWNCVYHKPRVSHEICIDGTYTDLSLKDRYKGTRVGKTDMFTSLERHLESKGVLKKAPLYFKNSSEWQRRVRKHCFEAVRLCDNMAGYDFLGPIDTHWHTFGYDVGMMNEFYELKPGESVRNVWMYNGPTVLLTDLDKEANFTAGDELACGIYVSHYGTEALQDACLTIRLSLDGKVIERRLESLDEVENGKLSSIYHFSTVLPKVTKPGALKLYVSLDGGDTFAENEWELYVFPGSEAIGADSRIVTNDVNTEIEAGAANMEKLSVSDDSNLDKLLVLQGMSTESLIDALAEGKDVVLFGAEPFISLPTSYRIALAGRSSDNLATVINDHPILRDMPHEGFCGWQFGKLLEGGEAVCFESDSVPFDPIIEVVSTHKFVIRQSALFEFNALNGRLLVCSLNFTETDPAAVWLKQQIISYAQSEEFEPKHTLDEEQLMALISGKVTKTAENVNLAFNPNDKTATRRKARS